MRYNVAIVGATGVVGRMILKVLEEYNFPINNLVLFASAKSKDASIKFKEEVYNIKELKEENIKEIDIAFFCAGGEVSKKWCKIFLNKKIIVIDNSSYFRMFKDVSLIVPEVNFESINTQNIIANPNCSTIQSVICLNALKSFKIKRVIYTTYQAVSGSGIKGINDLELGVNNFYPYNIRKTCIPQVDSFLDNGYTKEEMKMIEETKKILNLDGLEIAATCVRVPVLNSHAVSVVVTFEDEFDLEKIKQAFKMQEGIVFLLDEYPTSLHSNGNDFVYVGRVRNDLFDGKTFMFYCVADNLRRGAASNAVLIALKIIKNNLAYKNQL